MIQGVSGLMGSPGEVADAQEGGGASRGSSEVGAPPCGGGLEESDRNGGGGTRWPRQETLALLKIRSDMGAAFRDASLKAPLWEEVSRKMAEHGFQRSAKKCREKFENVYKYNKRTKEGRASRGDGKTYRFFEQLEALELEKKQQLRPQEASTPQVAWYHAAASASLPTSPTPLNVLPPPPLMGAASNPMSCSPFQPSKFDSMSSSSDEDVRGRKRKWKYYLERVMREMIEKQEERQKRFLETLEKRERERMAKEEALRVEEMARLSREHQLLVQERCMAAAKDAALMAFLKEMTGQQPHPDLDMLPPSVASSPPIRQPPSHEDEPSVLGTPTVVTGSSRWPKEEIQALIDLRTRLDVDSTSSGSKGPLWEEISSAMANLGYNRSSKRCKEKWENINKYYKKVKESNKKRPEDSRTCPYFNQLQTIYQDKAKNKPPSLNPTLEQSQ